MLKIHDVFTLCLSNLALRAPFVCVCVCVWVRVHVHWFYRLQLLLTNLDA